MITSIYLPKGSFTLTVRHPITAKHGTLGCWHKVILAIGLILSLLLSNLTTPSVQAQAEDESPLTIVEVETTQFPIVKLTLDGANWPTERAEATVQVLVNGAEQKLDADEVVQQNIGFLVAIDPNEILAAGQAGQTRYVQLTGALLNLVENGVLLRNEDWMAAYLLAPEGVQSIQAWTQEPNLVFNSIVQNRPAEVTNTPLDATTVINVLQQFNAEPVTAIQPRTLMLISAGADTLDVASVATAANELGVHIHALELVNGSSSGGPDSTLGQLAQQTGGQYVAVSSPNDLTPLWDQLAAAHKQRVLTFASSIPNPQSLEVRLALPTGAIVSATAAPTVFADLPVAATVAPDAQTVLTRAEAAPVANPLPATTNTQSTAPEVATVAQPAKVEPLPTVADSTNPEASGAIVIPGLQIALPRGLLQISLLVLILLIGYFVYAEARDRRKKHNAKQRGNRQAVPDYIPSDPQFALDENSQMIAANRFQLNNNDTSPETGFTVDPPSNKSTPPVKIAPPPARSAARPPARPPMRQSNFAQDDDEADATMRPPRMEDEEATYRVQEVEQPVIGYLMRATSDPNLPKELPIYGLNPAPGEVRQIHIGRHSKHNTVVINDKSISREHAVIVQREGRLYLRDNASTSGTFLNWKRLNPGEELLLRHNDLISFGQIVYEFRLSGEDEATIAEA